jgi:DNA-binding NtrC family response regulator
MFVVEATVLAVGVDGKAEALQELPIRLLLMNTGAEAVACLREEEIHTVISRWELVDMPDGRFLRNIIAAKPTVPTIAFVEAGDPQREIAARSLGVSAVLTDDTNDEYFRAIVCQILGLSNLSHIKATRRASKKYRLPGRRTMSG